MSKILAEWLVVVDGAGNPIGIDRDSGGYPYIPSNPGGVNYWPPGHLAKAEEYARMFHYTVKRVQLTILPGTLTREML